MPLFGLNYSDTILIPNYSLTTAMIQNSCINYCGLLSAKGSENKNKRAYLAKNVTNNIRLTHDKNTATEVCFVVFVPYIFKER